MLLVVRAEDDYRAFQAVRVSAADFPNLQHGDLVRIKFGNKKYIFVATIGAQPGTISINRPIHAAMIVATTGDKVECEPCKKKVGKIDHRS